MTTLPPIEPAPRAPLTDSRREVLPAGITARSETQYLVGSYRYTDLGHARSELARQGATPK